MPELQKTISYMKHLRLMRDRYPEIRTDFRGRARRIVIHELKHGSPEEAKKLALTFERILGDIDG